MCVCVCVCVFARAFLYVCVVVVQSLTCPTLSDPMVCIQHARLPCRSTSPGVCSNSWPLSQRCHPTIMSSVIPFSSCLQSFPPSGSFPMSWLFTSGGQSTGASASASVFPMNIQGWFPFGLTGVPADFYYLAIKSTLEPATTLPSPQWNQNFLLSRRLKKKKNAVSSFSRLICKSKFPPFPPIYPLFSYLFLFHSDYLPVTMARFNQDNTKHFSRVWPSQGS